jgi:hypothetical protein
MQFHCKDQIADLRKSLSFVWSTQFELGIFWALGTRITHFEVFMLEIQINLLSLLVLSILSCTTALPDFSLLASPSFFYHFERVLFFQSPDLAVGACRSIPSKFPGGGGRWG